MSEQAKVPYEASETKRFEVSRDEFSRQRIEVIKEIRQLVLDSLDVPVGTSAFGSLAKGKDLSERETAMITDIDMAVFVDYASLEQHRDQLSGNKRFQHAIDAATVALRDSGMREEEILEIGLGNYIKKIALEKIKKEARSLALPTASIAVYNISDTGAYSTMGQLEKYESAIRDGKLREPLTEDAKRRIALLFALDIGGGLKHYRQTFLAQLGQLDEETRNQKWGLVGQVIREIERLNQIPENLEPQFPQTYDEAVTYYGLPKPTQESPVT